LERVEINTTTAGPPSLPVNAVWRTIRGYILWSYERGTLHYDVMVTLILVFIFFSPNWINFNDKPVPRDPHPTGVFVTSDGTGALVYQIEAAAVAPGDDKVVRDELLHIIEPISGAVSIVRYDTVPDRKGKVQSYKVWVKRE
jgi:hypothetical protein